MSVQLVLSHYLAGLRERDELDALLPELLKAMGHSVLSRPQVGVPQAGVDVVSINGDTELLARLAENRADPKNEVRGSFFINVLQTLKMAWNRLRCRRRDLPELAIEDGNNTAAVFIFVIKFGDIGRGDFYGGPQAVDPSIREACNDFVRNRMPDVLRPLRKRIVLLTNGVLKQEAQAGLAALSKDIAERPRCSLEFWGSDQLTALIERHLFDETLLLSKGKSDLRAALAGLEESDAAVHRFVRFLESCFEGTAEESHKSEATRKKRFLKRCATALMGWAVLLVWGRSEDNLKPGVVAGEYLALRMWAEAVKAGFSEDKAFTQRLEEMVGMQVEALLEYFDKVMPQLKSRRAVLAHRPERLFYAELVFEELGRLATLLLLLQQFSGQNEHRVLIREQLLGLVNEHTGCQLPLYDGQTIDLTLIFTALMGESDWDNVKRLVSNVTRRLFHALQNDRYLPVDTDLLEDAVALNVMGEAKARDFFKTSTLVPVLATIAAFLGDENTLSHLRDDVYPLLEGVTLERWFPDDLLETFTGSRRHVQEVGVSRAVALIRATASEEKEASLQPFEGAADPTQYMWHETPWTILAALSARFHRHPVPTWFIAEYARPAE